MLVLFYFEVSFLVNKQYVAMFVDPLGKFGVIVWSIISFILIGIVALSIIKSTPKRVMYLAASLVLIGGLSTAALFPIDKSNKDVFRLDLGLQALYLYVDSSKSEYLLEYVSPLRKVTTVGKYNQIDSTIILDKNIGKALNIRSFLKDEPRTSFDLRRMTKLN
ncbi:MAG: hypothetical protein KDC92_03120 [Bacteroidetes bacterium]|nr:hypothetical protein [Bacteroidota bacterium]